MIGALSGDIIASPYNQQNISSPGHFVGWNLFEGQRLLQFRNRYTREVRTDIGNLDRKEARDWSPVEKVYYSGPTVQSKAMIAVADWLASSDERTAESFRDSLDRLDVSSESVRRAAFTSIVPIAETAGTADEAIRLAAVCMAAAGGSVEQLEDAKRTAHLLWLSYSGVPVEQIMQTASKKYGLDVEMNTNIISQSLRGLTVSDGNGGRTIGDGTRDESAALVTVAALDCIVRSQSFEEAVRRAVALGGHSSAVTTLTGAFAEKAFGEVPSLISDVTTQYFEDAFQEAMGRFDGMKHEAALKATGLQTTDTVFQVIRQEGQNSVYVVPEDRQDIESAVTTLCRKMKKDCEIIRPDQLQDVLAARNVQMNVGGRELDGTYYESPRAEVKNLWYQNGEIRNAVRRIGEGVDGRTLPKVERRMQNFTEWNDLRSYANNVRRELEDKVQASRDGRSIHFASAFYPQVYENHIDLMKGDIIRGRVRFDDNGTISVDTNLHTGGMGGEYLQGVLDTMNIFPSKAGAMEIKTILDEYCLDFGKIEDEDERKALQTDDQESVSVQMKYRSNIDRAIADVAAVRGEMEEAVVPEVSRKTEKRMEKVAKQIEESRKEGRTIDDALAATSHKGSLFTIGHSNLKTEELEKLLTKYGIEVLVDVRSYPSSKFNPQFNGGEAENGKASALEQSCNGIDVEYQFMGFALGGHQRRSKDETYSLYRLESDDPSQKPQYGLFHSDEECNQYCGQENRKRGQTVKIDTFEKLSESEVKAFCQSKDCPVELRQEIEVKTGKYLSYEEIADKPLFKENMKNIREAVRDGLRVAVMCSEGDPMDCHRMALIGKVMAHPEDGRIKPIDVQHITRGGYLLSQEYFENKMLDAVGLKSEPDALEKVYHKKGLNLMTQKKEDKAIRLSQNASKKKSYSPKH